MDFCWVRVQISECTLVILGVGTIALAIAGDWAGLVTAAAAMTLVIAPAWTSRGLHLAGLLAKRERSSQLPSGTVMRDHPVLSFGMTDEGRLAADALRDNGLPYLDIDQDPERLYLLFRTAMEPYSAT